MKNNIDIKNFKGLSVDVKMDQIIDTNAELCANELKQTSPEGHRHSKTYREGWTVKKGVKREGQYYAEVWNATNYQLTHLLENGHLIVNKRGGVGWAGANPHIQKALDYVKPMFISDMEKADIDVNFE